MRNKNTLRILLRKYRRYAIGCLILMGALYFATVGYKAWFNQKKANEKGFLLQGTISEEDASKQLPALNKINGVRSTSKVIERDLNTSYRGKECNVHVTGIDNTFLQDKLLAGSVYEKGAMKCVITKEAIYHLNFGDGEIKEKEKASISVTDWLGKKIQIKNDSGEKSYSLTICGIIGEEGSAVYMPLPVMERLCKEEKVTSVSKEDKDSGEDTEKVDGDDTAQTEELSSPSEHEGMIEYRFLLKNYSEYEHVSEQLIGCNVTLNDSYQEQLWKMEKSALEVRQDVWTAALLGIIGCVVWGMQLVMRKELRKKQEMDLRILGMSRHQVTRLNRITGIGILGLLAVFELACFLLC